MPSLVALFCKDPSQFYPGGTGLAPEERAQRGARLVLYCALAQALRKRDARVAAAGLCAACAIMHFYGRPTTIDPATAGTTADPDPTGNPSLGDVGGRHGAPRIGTNLTPAMLFQRMQNPQEGYLDRAIAPTLGPLDANYVISQEPSLGRNKWTEFSGGSGPPHGKMTVQPRGGAPAPLLNPALSSDNWVPPR